MSEQERAAFRAFVRAHHPDRGGDPDVFVAGMARFQEATPQTGARTRAAPVEVVVPLPGPVRVALALLRTLRWHRNRRHRVQ